MRKLTGLAGLLAIAVLDFRPVPAEACGVKLTIKTAAPRKAVARTSRPSQVLLVGSPPRRLERDLAAAGHSVESAPTSGAAKKTQYAVVIVDNNDQAGEARSKFPNSTVVVRSGEVGADLRSVENTVARRPVDVVAIREPEKVLEPRVPIKVGPDQDKNKPGTLVAVKEPSEPVAPPDPVTPPTPPMPPPVKTTPPPKENISTGTPRGEERAPKEPKVVATAKDLKSELYFGVGSASLNKSRLAKAVKWLSANPDAQVVVEGHADPSGTPEGNMTLSQTRAETVKDYLVSTGVDASRIEVAAFGDTKLKYGRSDSRNRRVAIESKK